MAISTDCNFRLKEILNQYIISDEVKIFYYTDYGILIAKIEI